MGCIKRETRQSIPPLSFINGRIVFNQTAYPDVFAVAVVVNNETSLAYLWDKNNNSVNIKVAYTPPKDILPVYQKILSLNIIIPPNETISGEEILPFNLRYEEEINAWKFNYYDRWSSGRFSEGGAIYYQANQTIVMEWHIG